MDVPPRLQVAESIRWANQPPGGKGIGRLASRRLADPGECGATRDKIPE